MGPVLLLLVAARSGPGVHAGEPVVRLADHRKAVDVLEQRQQLSGNAKVVVAAALVWAWFQLWQFVLVMVVAVITPLAIHLVNVAINTGFGAPARTATPT